jgi:hypothetical protein
MTQVTEYQGGGLPVRQGARATGNSALSAGLGVSFSVMSIRGKTFRIKQGKQETELLDKRGNPIPELEVVIVDANPDVSRTYYAGGYNAATGVAPTCASSNGVTPDGGEQPQSTSCRVCPRAVRDQVTPSGAKVSSCQNHRRIAIVPVSDLANEGLGGAMLLRVPGGSLMNLSNYSHNLTRRNFEFWEVATTLQFDPSVSHPKLLFHPERALQPDEQAVVDDLRCSEATQAVLAVSEAQEHAAANPPAAAPKQDAFDALGSRSERRPDPRTTQAAQSGYENISPAAQSGHPVIVEPVSVEPPKARRTRAKPTIADAVSAPVVVEPAAGGFEQDLDARLKSLIS